MDITILGLDPGMAKFGWSGVILGSDNKIELGLCGMMAHPRDTNAPFNAYLDEGIEKITDQFPVILSILRPTFITAETVPTGRIGSRSELVVAAITVAKVIAYQWGIPWFNVGANTVKKMITDDGTATKVQVRNAVIELFPVLGEKHKAAKVDQKKQGEKIEGLPQDVYDSIAVAITGAKKYGVTNGTTDNREAPHLAGSF